MCFKATVLMVLEGMMSMRDRVESPFGKTLLGDLRILANWSKYL